MAIQFKLLPDGGFVCGDTQTKRTSYAYPTSVFAEKAKTHGANVARAMLAVTDPYEDEYNARNWAKLNS